MCPDCMAASQVNSHHVGGYGRVSLVDTSFLWVAVSLMLQVPQQSILSTNIGTTGSVEEVYLLVDDCFCPCRLKL